MYTTNTPTISVAILDMYEGAANQGMRCIKELLNQYAEQEDITIAYTVYEVRLKKEIPNLGYDFYISTGGPGSPIDSTGSQWELAFNTFLQKLISHNLVNEQKKYMFFICHSFQLACKFFNIGELSKRKSTSFGVFPISMLPSGGSEAIFEGLHNPFYVVDSRDYQVINPNLGNVNALGASILAIEKERLHVALPRAVMAVRFNAYMFGTQFHPEADAMGMRMHLQTDEKKKTVIENHGEQKWASMIDQLADPEKIMYTYNHIFPNYFKLAISLVPTLS